MPLESGAFASAVLGLDRAVLSTVFEGAPAGVGVCDADGRFVAVNAALTSLLGVAAERMVGRPFLTFVHPQERALSLSCYFRSVVAAAARRPATAERSELHCLTGSGAVIRVSVAWTVSAPDAAGDQYAVVHLTDVTALREAKRQLAEVAQRFELAFRWSPIGMALLDLDGRLLQANTALERMSGYGADELAGMTFLQLLHPEDQAESAETFARIVAGEVGVDDAVRRYVRRDGSLIYTRRVAVPLREPDGRVQCVLVQLEEVTGERLAPAPTSANARRVTCSPGCPTGESLAYELDVSAALRSLLMIAVRGLSRFNRALGRSGSHENPALSRDDANVAGKQRRRRPAAWFVLEAPSAANRGESSVPPPRSGPDDAVHSIVQETGHERGVPPVHRSGPL